MQNEIKIYLKMFGITKSHMAKTIGISISQLSSWMSGKLVLPDYHMVSIKNYLTVLRAVDGFLNENNLAL